MLRILSQDNLDHRGGFLKPLNKTHILQNKYLLSEQIIPLYTIPTPDPHLGPGIVRGQVTITRCSIPSGPEVSSQDICWHSDTLHFLLLPHAALCVSVWEYSDETRAPGIMWRAAAGWSERSVANSLINQHLFSFSCWTDQAITELMEIFTAVSSGWGQKLENIKLRSRATTGSFL